MGIFDMDTCNVAQMLGESSRFLFHITLIHIGSILIDGDSIMGDKFFKTAVMSVMAVICYHMFVRKWAEPNIKKMKIICKRDGKRNKNRLRQAV